ncbi:MAG: hypothetical protein RIS56_712, partial [Verrucomicrobiota bacterium]
MRAHPLNRFPHLGVVLGIWILVMAALPAFGARVQELAPFPPTYADPAVPLLQLPTDFRARR